jgi:hypothetical protein
MAVPDVTPLDATDKGLANLRADRVRLDTSQNDLALHVHSQILGIKRLADLGAASTLLRPETACGYGRSSYELTRAVDGIVPPAVVGPAEIALSLSTLSAGWSSGSRRAGRRSR